MKPLKSKVSITLDSDIIEKIKQFAENDDRSFSQYINLILKEYLNQKEAQDSILCFYIMPLYSVFVVCCRHTFFSYQYEKWALNLRQATTGDKLCM